MRDIEELLERWQLDVGEVRERMYRAPTPRERERWHALALGQGLDRIGGSRGTGTGAPHHRRMGRCLQRQWTGGPCLRAVGWFPPALDGDQQAQVKAVVQALPEKAPRKMRRPSRQRPPLGAGSARAAPRENTRENNTAATPAAGP